MVIPSTLIICGTRRKAKTSGQGIFVTDNVNPRADFHPTWKCEIWVRDVEPLKPGSNKDSEGEPKIPEHIFVKQPVYMTFTASTQGCFT